MQTNEEVVLSDESLPASPSSAQPDDGVVSTHVLVPKEQLVRLRELSRRTRVAQSEYLREAVEDLLHKYGCLPPDSR
jgi:hypothetical protein